MKGEITLRQAQVLCYIHVHRHVTGESPTYPEMMDRFCYSGNETAPIRNLVRRLAKNGYITTKKHIPRSVEPAGNWLIMCPAGVRRAWGIKLDGVVNPPENWNTPKKLDPYNY